MTSRNTLSFSDRARQSWNELDGRRGRIVRFALFAVTLLVMTCALYSGFLFGNRALVFVDVGSDSWAQSVPFFLNASERFAQLDFSTWDFSQYLGTQTIQAVNPEYLVSMFGKELVGPMMLAMQMAKVFLTGIFFYLFTSYWNLRYITRFTSSLGIAFCGRMVALAAWTGYTMEVMLAIALLWAFERFLADSKKFVALPICFALVIATLGLYGAVLYSFVMLVYVAFRIGYGEHRLETTREIAMFVAQLLALYVLGILLIAVTLFPTVAGYRDSARVASNTGNILLPQTVPVEVYAAEALSLFTPAALGSMTDYAGPCNTLNNPYFYCGVLLLLGAPFAFRGKSKRQRIWLGLFAGIALAYMLSASLRYVLNGFGIWPDDFRMSSFWITIAIAVLGMLGLDALLRRAEPGPVLCACIVYLLLLGVACLILRDFVRKPWVALSIACLVFYAIVLVYMSCRNRGIALGALLVAVCICELLGQNWVMANNVYSVTKDEYLYEYNETFPALLDEVDGEDDDLYRIDWKTALLCRSMAYGYRGTLAYIGGTGFSKAQTEFMSNVLSNDYVSELGYSRYAYGFYDNALNTLLGVRYLIYDMRQQEGDTAYYAPYGYNEIVHDDNGFRIYENGNALPFLMSYGYDETMSSDQLLALDRIDRASALFGRCVVPNDRSFSREPAESLFPDEAATRIAASDETLTEGGKVVLAFDASDEPYLVARMNLRTSATEGINTSITILLENEATGETLTIPYFTASGNEDIAIPVENGGYTRAEVSFARYYSPKSPLTVSEIEIDEAPASYFSRYESACSDKLDENPVMSQATSDHIAGSLDAADDGYIVTSVPWSESWHAYVDGSEVETFPVNYGFVGMETRSGHHDVELAYRDTPREIGAWLSVAALLCLVAARAIAGRSRRGARGKRACETTRCAERARP